MTTIRKRLTLDEFLAQPDTEPASEYVCGEVVQKPMPDTPHSRLQLFLAMLLYQFVSPRKLGWVGTEWRCIFGPAGMQRAFVPDIVYASYERMPPGDARANRFLRTAPDLAVEILSPDHHGALLAAKIQFYLRHGVRLVWAVDPDDEAVYVYTPDRDDEVLRPGDTLTGGDVLPGFAVPVADIFAQLQN
jgi:Uma2 family endonuclease